MKINQVGKVRTFTNGTACVLFKKGSFRNVGLEWPDLQVLFVCLSPNPRHVEVPRPRIKSEPQLCQDWILNPVHWATDGTFTSAATGATSETTGATSETTPDL